MIVLDKTIRAAFSRFAVFKRHPSAPLKPLFPRLCTWCRRWWIARQFQIDNPSSAVEFAKYLAYLRATVFHRVLVSAADSVEDIAALDL